MAHSGDRGRALFPRLPWSRRSPRFFSELEQNEEILRFEPREYIGQGDRVVVLGDYAAKVKSTGRKFEMQWVHLYTVRNGKIASFQEFGDTAVAAKAYQRQAVPVSV